MTLQEIIDSLPNGLHDSQVHSINLDYMKREAKLSLDVWVGGISPDEKVGEAYRRGELKLSGLLYWVAEPPDPTYPYDEANALWIDAGCPASSNPHLSVKLPEPLPEGAFSCWFYVADWNAFIYAAAMGASVEWL